MSLSEVRYQEAPRAEVFFITCAAGNVRFCEFNKPAEVR
jgi:hypothetical protein